METSKDLFRELEKAEQLFSNGSIRNGQKVLREVLKASKSLNKVSNKLRHKINYVLNESKYFDEMSSFATNPKRDNLIDEVNKLVSNPIKEPKKHAHAIHNLQRQWQLLDISGKSASKNQWNKFNDLSNKAWDTITIVPAAGINASDGTDSTSDISGSPTGKNLKSDNCLSNSSNILINSKIAPSKKFEFNPLKIVSLLISLLF